MQGEKNTRNILIFGDRGMVAARSGKDGGSQTLMVPPVIEGNGAPFRKEQVVTHLTRATIEYDREQT